MDFGHEVDSPRTLLILSLWLLLNYHWATQGVNLSEDQRRNLKIFVDMLLHHTNIADTGRKSKTEIRV